MYRRTDCNANAPSRGLDLSFQGGTSSADATVLIDRTLSTGNLLGNLWCCPLSGNDKADPVVRTPQPPVTRCRSGPHLTLSHEVRSCLRPVRRGMASGFAGIRRQGARTAEVCPQFPCANFTNIPVLSSRLKEKENFSSFYACRRRKRVLVPRFGSGKAARLSRNLSTENYFRNRVSKIGGRVWRVLPRSRSGG